MAVKGKGRHLGRDALLAALGLAAGLGLAILVGPGLSFLSQPGSPIPTVAESPSVQAVGDEAEVAPAGVAPSGPRETVEGFLQAESDRDFEASFAYLSSGDRSVYDVPAQWEAAHPEVFPPVAAFQVVDIQDTQVGTELEFDATLSPSVGLVPGRAEVLWVTVEEEGGWRIELERTTVNPQYPSEDVVAPVVEAWVADRQACRPATEWSGGLRGRPDLAEDLCGIEGEVRLGEVGYLDDSVDAAPFLAAFGAEFDLWARAISLRGPVPLRVVVAPIGETWTVIGVLGGEGS